MESKDKMLIAIRSRRDLEPTLISLGKLLASDGMENYLGLCSDRLAECGKIDGEDTQIYFANFPDILFNSEGLFDCRHILENYLPADLLLDSWETLRIIERDKEEINNVAAAFRKMTLQELLTMYKNQKLSESAEAGQLVRKWIAAEIWNRSFFPGIWRKVKEFLMQIYVKMKYKQLFDIMRSITERHIQKTVAGD